jgi:hypothetical protein
LFQISKFRISTMEIGQNAPADKPALRARDRLPNRRTSIHLVARTVALECGVVAKAKDLGLIDDEDGGGK